MAGQGQPPLEEVRGQERPETQVLGNLPSRSPGLGGEGRDVFGGGVFVQGINYCKGVR